MSKSDVSLVELLKIFVTKEELIPMRMFFYGLAGTILFAFLGVLISFVFKK